MTDETNRGETGGQPEHSGGPAPGGDGGKLAETPPTGGSTNLWALALKIVLPVILIGGSASIARTLIENRPEPEREEREDRGLLVEVTEVSESAHRLDVTADGTVMAARQVVLSPQVSGRVTWIDESLSPGGLVAAEQDLVRIDDDDYDLAVDVARAERERAEAVLEIEQGRQVVARREWEMFADQVPDDAAGRALALREPQEREAEQAVELAATRVRQARLNQRRTRIAAPFNAFVQGENVEIGQVVAPGSQIATLVGTDEFWVQVQVPLNKLPYFDIPGVNATEGSRAVVRQELGSQRVEREGRVSRLLPDLDPVGRTARVIVRVEDPLNLAAPPGGRGMPLLIGSYVHVEIEGSRQNQLIEVPRVAIREGDKVYVMTDERTLEIRDVDIVWGLPDSVLVGSGLSDGDTIVVSRVGTAVPGMGLRTAADEGTGQGTGDGTGSATSQVHPAADDESPSTPTSASRAAREQSNESTTE